MLITGGAGFIGSRLFKELADTTDDLVVVDLKHGSDLMDYNKKHDVVYHLAANIDARDNSVKTFLYNLKLTEKAISLAKKKIIFASSVAVYGEGLSIDDNGHTERHKLRPINRYGLYKKMSENLIRESRRDYTIFRFGNVWGEGSNGLISLLKRGEKIKVLNEGKGIRDYVHVDDIVNAIINYADKKETYNIATGNKYRTIDLVKKSGIEYKLDKSLTKEIMFSIINPSKLKKRGWKPNKIL